ncbi:hypothetical protein V6R21_32290 [Limibacter armeniacum]|uniref:hypothetical protein n=1 Tax=Limibacter armeniacum TaxID=466084 RepID=UPI002FE60B78
MKRKLGGYYKKLLNDKGNLLDRIKANSIDESVELSAKEQAASIRIRAAWSMLLSGQKKSNVVISLMDEFGICESQAYKDCKAAYRLYGNLNIAEKEGLRAIHYELAMDAFRIAAKAKDVEFMLRANEQMIKLSRLEQADGAVPDLPTHQYLIQLISNGEVIDIDFEDLSSLPKQKHQMVVDAMEEMEVSREEMKMILDGKEKEEE